IKIISRLSLPFPSPASRLFYSMGSKVIPLIVALISLNSLSAQSPTAACVACVNNPTQYFNTATNTCVNLVLWGLRDAVCGLTLPNSTAVCDPFNCPVDPPSTFAYNENNAKNVYWRLQGALKLDTASPTFTQCTQNAASDIIFVDRVNVTCGVPFPIDTCITDVYVIPSLSQIVSVSRGSNNITQIFQMVLTLAAPIYPILSNGNNGMLAISYFQDAANKTWEVNGQGVQTQIFIPFLDWSESLEPVEVIDVRNDRIDIHWRVPEEFLNATTKQRLVVAIMKEQELQKRHPKSFHATLHIDHDGTSLWYGSNVAKTSLAALNWLPPPMELMVIAKGNDSLEISWAPPDISTGQHHVAINQYFINVYEFYPESQTFTKKFTTNIPIPKTSFLGTRLNPGNVYNITIQA
ncbi:unnamed protein product, partial [Mesorhabditis belari]|uniref:Fibronectin type-III domain-containing protein n=1 Tax=Mesorhabditis belari TaxID=2138241 RepID=A0AAF3F9N3_9BILA